MIDMFDLYRPLSMRLASNDPLFALLIANEYVSAVNKSYQWLKYNGVDVTESEIEEFARLIEGVRFETPLIDDGKIYYVNDHLPKQITDNRIWRMQGEHCVLSMRLAKPQIGAGEIFTAGAIDGACLTNATVLKGDVVASPRSIEIKDAGTQKIEMKHLNSYVEHDLDILVYKSVSNKLKPQEAKRSRYKMFPAKDFLKHMYVAGESVKFNSFMED
jgi:hypothetical protein